MSAAHSKTFFTIVTGLGEFFEYSIYGGCGMFCFFFRFFLFVAPPPALPSFSLSGFISSSDRSSGWLARWCVWLIVTPWAAIRRQKMRGDNQLLRVKK